MKRSRLREREKFEECEVIEITIYDVRYEADEIGKEKRYESAVNALKDRYEERNRKREVDVESERPVYMKGI